MSPSSYDASQSKRDAPGGLRRVAPLSLLICCILVFATLVAYLGVVGCGFVFDDESYLLENPHIQQGLNGRTIAWAFTSAYCFNWHPLTWLSHAADYQVHGFDPAGHHVTSLLVHLLTSVLLFLFLKKMTGTTGRSAVVAGLFALHPAHVESVAWISERKDVLSAFFWVLTMGAYAWYAHRPSLVRYLSTLVVFSLGLLTKQMAVTLPFVLLLLDYWPLARLRLGGAGGGGAVGLGGRRYGKSAPLSKLAVEKIPFLILAVAAGVATVIAQERGGAIANLEVIPFVLRVKNALLSYVAYVGKMFWPAGLSPFYPYRESIPWWQAGVAFLSLTAITAWVLRSARRRPYAVVGWLWYLGTLVPVIGLVQVGQQAMADRYTYIPFIGLFILVCWLVFDLVGKRRAIAAPLLVVAAAAVLIALSAITYVQVGYWKDNITLFERALAVTSNNHFAHNNLGRALVAEGRLEEAIEHFRRSVSIKPDVALSRGNLGAAALDLGLVDEAIEQQRMAVQLDPEDPINRINLAGALAAGGRFEEASDVLAIVLENDPENVPALVTRGRLLAAQGRKDESRASYEAALRHDPTNVQAHVFLADLLARQGRVEEAMRHLATVIQREPLNVVALSGYGTLLVGRGRFAEAVPILSRAIELAPNLPDAQVSLAHALLAQGMVEDAFRHYERAVMLRPGVDAEYIGYGKNLAPQAHFGYGHTLAALGRPVEAARGYEDAHRLSPGWLPPITALAWLLATTENDSLRSADRAMALATEACRLTENRDPKALDALAAAHAEKGRFDEAIRFARSGVDAARATGRQRLAESIERRIEGYAEGRPFRERAVNLGE